MRILKLVKKQKIQVLLIFVFILNPFTEMLIKSTNFYAETEKIEDVGTSTISEKLKPHIEASELEQSGVEENSPNFSLLDEIYRNDSPFSGFIQNLGQLGNNNSYIKYYHNFETGKIGFGLDGLHYISSIGNSLQEPTYFSLQFLNSETKNILPNEKMAGYHNVMTSGMSVSQIPSYSKIEYSSIYPGISSMFIGGDQGNLDEIITVSSIGALENLILKTNQELLIQTEGKSIKFVELEKSRNPLLDISEIFAFDPQGNFLNIEIVQHDAHAIGFDLSDQTYQGQFSIFLGSILPGIRSNTLKSESLHSTIGPRIADSDLIPPIISQVSHIPTTPSDSDNVEIRASVTDPSGVSQVLVYFKVDSDTEWSMSPMILDVETFYSAFIGYNSIGVSLSYFIETFDNSVNFNTVNSSLYGFTVVESVETDPPELQNVEIFPVNPTDQEEVVIRIEVPNLGTYHYIIQYKNYTNIWYSKSMGGIDGNYEISLGKQTGFVEYNIFAENIENPSNSVILRNGSVNFNFTSVDTQYPVFLSQQYSPDVPQPQDLVSIEINVEDQGLIEITTLFYQINYGSWVNTSMNSISKTKFTAEIGPFLDGESINYYFTVKDFADHELQIDNSGLYYTFLIQELVLDEQDSFSTYFGEGSHSKIKSLQVDQDGYIYVAGSTESFNFPCTPGAFIDDWNLTAIAAFITKITPDGQEMVFSTLIGAMSTTDESWEKSIIENIALDSSRNIYAVGSTNNPIFPIEIEDVENTPVQDMHYGGYEGFLLKLSPDGSDLRFSTFIGSFDGNVNATAVILDEFRNIYVTGTTTGDDMQTTTGTYQPNFPGSLEDHTAGFLAKISYKGTYYKFLTYLGGMTDYFPKDIVLDSQKNIFVVGSAECGMMDCTIGRIGGYIEGFVTEIQNDGKALIMQRFTTGSGDDFFESITISDDNYPVIAGYSNSSSFDFSLDGMQSSYQGGQYDGLVITLKNDSSGEIHHGTYVGTPQDDRLYSVALNTQNEIFLGGITDSYELMLSPNNFQKNNSGESDCFIYKIDSNLSSYSYGSYFGGNLTDTLVEIAIDSNDFVYFVGLTNSGDLNTTLASLQPNMQNSSSFITKVSPKTVKPVITLHEDHIIYAEIDSLQNITMSAYSLSGIQNISVYYTIDDQLWVNIPTTRLNDTHFQALFGSFSPNTRVKYYMEIYDASSMHTRVINNNFNQYYYIIYPCANSGDDSNSPSLEIYETKQEDDLFKVFMNATDENSIAAVILYYFIDLPEYDSFDENDWNIYICQETHRYFNLEDSKWEISFTCEVESLPKGVDLIYYFDVVDNSESHNLIRYSVNYFYFADTDTSGPQIFDLTITPNNPTERDRVLISATITDESDVQSAYVKYCVDDQEWIEVELIYMGNNRFQADLGKFQDYSTLFFYIYATDTTSNENYREFTDGGEYFEIDIEYIDNVKPILSDLCFPEEPVYLNQNFSINFEVYDMSNISQVDFYYQYIGEQWEHLLLSANQFNRYQLDFDSGTRRTEFRFYFRLIDNSTLKWSSIYDNYQQYYVIPIYIQETGTIWIDDSETCKEFSNIRVFDEDRNLFQSEIDTISVWVNSSISNSHHELVLYETGVDTGVFSGIVYYSAFGDHQNDVQIEDNTEISINYFDPFNQDFESENIELKYRWVAPESAILSFSKVSYTKDETIMVSVIDLDLNQNNSKLDTCMVKITSTIDRNGFILPLLETGPNSSVFVASFQVNEQNSNPDTYEILCWDGWDIMVEYIDRNHDQLQFSIIEYVEYNSPTSKFGFQTTIYPIQPSNGDQMRFILSIPLRLGVDKINIHTESQILPLNFSYSSIFENVFVGWVLLDEPDLIFTYSFELILLNGSIINSQVNSIDTLPAEMNFQCDVINIGEETQFHLLAYDIRAHPVEEVEFLVYVKKEGSYQNKVLIDQITSEDGQIIYQLDASALNLTGFVRLSFEAIKEGYVSCSIDYLIEISLGLEMHTGYNYYSLNEGGFTINMYCIKPCWLLFRPYRTPYLGREFSDYTGLWDSFFRIYIMQENPHSDWPFTYIKFTTKIDHPDLANYDPENIEIIEYKNWDWVLRFSHYYQDRVYESYIYTSYYSDYYNYIQQNVIEFANYGIVAKTDAIHSDSLSAIYSSKETEINPEGILSYNVPVMQNNFSELSSISWMRDNLKYNPNVKFGIIILLGIMSLLQMKKKKPFKSEI